MTIIVEFQQTIQVSKLILRDCIKATQLLLHHSVLHNIPKVPCHKTISFKENSLTTLNVRAGKRTEKKVFSVETQFLNKVPSNRKWYHVQLLIAIRTVSTRGQTLLAHIHSADDIKPWILIYESVTVSLLAASSSPRINAFLLIISFLHWIF